MKHLDSFSLTKYVKQPIHDKRHALDLVLAHHFYVDEVNLVDFTISDHKAVLFQVPLLFPDSKPLTLIHSSPLNSLSVPSFYQAFMSSSMVLNTNEQHGLTVDELVCGFNSSCTNILDSIAPVRLKVLKPHSLPWLNEELGILKRQCRMAERKWKKGQLSVSFVSLKELMLTYQCTIREARNNYKLIELTAKQGHNPRILGLID